MKRRKEETSVIMSSNNTPGQHSSHAKGSMCESTGPMTSNTNINTGVTGATGASGGNNECNSSSPRYKKIFIQRDYSQGTAVRFQTTFPPELTGYIDQETFSYLINNINTMYAQGESMSTRVFCESFCACISAYFLYLCIEPYYDKCARKVGDFIEEQNDLRWKRRGLIVTDPLERGLRVIEITIFLDKVPH